MVFKFRKRKHDHCELPHAYKKRIKEISCTISSGRISLHSEPTGNRQLRLKLYYVSNCICELGNYCIEEGGEEKMQNLLLFRLFIYTFLRLFAKNIMDLNGKVDIELLMEVNIAPLSLEPSIYKQAFTKLLDAACYFYLHPDQKTELKKLATEMLRIIRPAAADDLLRALASHYTQIFSKDRRENKNIEFNISYSSNLDGVCQVHCMCPLLSMKRGYHKEISGFGDVLSHLSSWKRKIQHKVSYLESTLKNHRLECRVELHPKVKFHKKSIEVRINIKTLCCGALPFKLGSHKSVQMRPVYISVKVCPTETSHLYGAYPGASSSNPEVNFSQNNAIEGGIGISLKPGFSGQVNGKITDSYTVASPRKNWDFEASQTNNREGSFKWTLFHHSYPEKPVYSYSPKSRSNKYKAFQGLLRAVGPTSPFTEGGAVEFAEDMYGTPILWTFYKSVSGKTLDWSVECEIWMAYYYKDCMEIRHQTFHDVFQFPMKRSQR